MAELRFGKHEQVTCIVSVDARAGGGEPACLAYKTTSYWIGAGAYLSDDGYVLKPRAQPGVYSDVYYELPEGAADGSAEGLPHPLPPYSIPLMEYVGGYSLWLLIGVVLVWTLAQRLRRPGPDSGSGVHPTRRARRRADR